MVVRTSMHPCLHLGPHTAPLVTGDDCASGGRVFDIWNTACALRAHYGIIDTVTAHTDTQRQT